MSASVGDLVDRIHQIAASVRGEPASEAPGAILGLAGGWCVVASKPAIAAPFHRGWSLG